MSVVDSKTMNNAMINNSGGDGSNSDVLYLPDSELFSDLQSDNVDVIAWVNKALEPHIRTTTTSSETTCAPNLEEMERVGLQLYSSLRQLVQTEKENVEELISESFSLLPRTAMEVTTMSEDVNELESQLQEVSSLLLHPTSCRRRGICNEHSNLANTNPSLTSLAQASMEQEPQNGAEDAKQVPSQEIDVVIQEVNHLSSVRDKLEHCSKLLSNVLAVEDGMSTLANSITVIKRQNSTEPTVMNAKSISKANATDIDQLAMDVKRVRDYLCVINAEDAAYGAQKYKALEEYEVFIQTSLEKEAQVSFAMNNVERAAYLYTMLRNIGKSDVLLHKYVISITSPLEHTMETYLTNMLSSSSNGDSGSNKLEENKNFNKSSNHNQTIDHEAININRVMGKAELREDRASQLGNNNKWLLIAVQTHLLQPLRSTLWSEFAFLWRLQEIVRSNMEPETEKEYDNMLLRVENNNSKEICRYTGTENSHDTSETTTTKTTTATTTMTTTNVDQTASLELLSESSFAKELLFRMIDIIAASFSKHMMPFLLAKNNNSLEATETISNSMITECYHCIRNFSLLDNNTECDLFMKEEKQKMERQGKEEEQYHSEESKITSVSNAGKRKEDHFISSVAQKEVLEACNAKIVLDLGRPFHDMEVVQMFCQRANKTVEQEVQNSCSNVANLHRLTAALLSGLIECLHFLPRETIECCAIIWRSALDSLITHYKVQCGKSQELLVHNYLMLIYVIRTYIHLLHVLMSKVLTSTLHNAIKEETIVELTRCMEQQVWLETDNLLEEQQEKYENAIMSTIELPLLAKIADYAHLRVWSNKKHRESNINNNRNSSNAHNTTEIVGNTNNSDNNYSIMESQNKSTQITKAEYNEYDSVPKPALVMYNVGQISPSSVIRDFGDAIMGIALALDSLRTIITAEYTSIIASQMYHIRQAHLSLLSPTSSTSSSSAAAAANTTPLSLLELSYIESIQFTRSNLEIEQWLEALTEKWLDKVVHNVIDNFIEDKVMNITIDFISSCHHGDANLSSAAKVNNASVTTASSNNNNNSNANAAHESGLAIEQLKADINYLLNILRAVSDQPFDNLQSVLTKLDAMSITDHVQHQPFTLRDKLKVLSEKLEQQIKN